MTEVFQGRLFNFYQSGVSISSTSEEVKSVLPKVASVASQDVSISSTSEEVKSSLHAY